MDNGNEARSTDRTRDQILTDHRELGKLLRELEHPDDMAELPALLHDLHLVLQRHFAREVEKDGLFEIIENRAPRHQQKLTELAGQHDSLLVEIAKLNELAGKRSDDPALAAGIDAFTLHLKEHEREESDLLIDALSTDLGQGD